MDKPVFHLLIADDDEGMRYAIRRLVSRHYPAAKISEAGNGGEALKLYERTGADLMIVDYRMPQMDGIEFVRALKERASSTPIIMVSSHLVAREEGMAAGVTAFVDKGDLVKTLIHVMEPLILK
ncbi:response regulator transcription factor [Pedosphaera parvula]|nr:response regulator transcription factor [Pedosphaera parvula]